MNPRMGPGVDFLQGLDRHLGVDLGGFEAGVAQHLLNETDVGAPSVLYNVKSLLIHA